MVHVHSPNRTNLAEGGATMELDNVRPNAMVSIWQTA